MLSGTTCATILTRAIFAEGCKSVAAGMNAMDLRRGISMAVDTVVATLKSRARMISTSEEIAQVRYCLSQPILMCCEKDKCWEIRIEQEPHALGIMLFSARSLMYAYSGRLGQYLPMGIEK